MDCFSRKPIPAFNHLLGKEMLNLHNFLLKKVKEEFVAWNSINLQTFEVFFLAAIFSSCSILKFTSFRVSGNQKWYPGNRKRPISHRLHLKRIQQILLQ